MNFLMCLKKRCIFLKLFYIGRVVDRVTPYLFVMCWNYGDSDEKRQRYKYIDLKNHKYKIFQYADDMGIFLNWSQGHSNKLLCTDRKLHVGLVDETCIKQWEKQNISLLGKITVVKNMLIPVLTHLFISIPSLDRFYYNKK